MSRTLLVVAKKTFRITIPDEAKVTFGPWSPGGGENKYGQSDKALNGTLRVYANAKASATVLGVFSGVTEFRDSDMEYEEQVAREEGAVLWKSDKDGYKREEKVRRSATWAPDPLLTDGTTDESDEDETDG